MSGRTRHQRSCLEEIIFRKSFFWGEMKEIIKSYLAKIKAIYIFFKCELVMFFFFLILKHHIHQLLLLLLSFYGHPNFTSFRNLENDNIIIGGFKRPEGSQERTQAVQKDTHVACKESMQWSCMYGIRDGVVVVPLFRSLSRGFFSL